MRLSAKGGDPAIAGRGRYVDVAWRENAKLGYVIRYARSTDRGRSFGPSRALSSKSGSAWSPSVGRGPGGLVAVAWFDNSDFLDPTIRVAVSRDGGVSFSRPRTLAHTSHGHVEVAVGKGVLYVAYTVYGAPNNSYVRRSTDGGRTWRPATQMPGTPSIAAEGSAVYAAYATAKGKVRFIRSLDKGSTWNSLSCVSPPDGVPAMSLVAGILRAAFTRRLVDPPDSWAVFYSQSSDGIHWTKAQRVSTDATVDVAGPDGVAFGGRVVVLYSAGSSEDDTFDVFAAWGKP